MIIDISHHQRPEYIDYDKIASQIDGAILRAAYGTGAPGKFEGADPSFLTHYNELHSRGVPIGAYHYITEYQPIDEQARLFIDAVRGLDLQLGYWCDVELESGADRLTAKSVIRWMQLVEAELGECGVYAAKWCWADIMGDEYARYSSRKLWMAAYVADPMKYIPPGWNDYHLWQYTSSGRLDGYGGNLDMNKRGTQMTDILLDIAPLSQMDARWRYEKLGTSSSTIGGYGCLITSASMMLNSFGFDTDPSRLNKLLIENGGYHDGNLFVWDSLSKIFPGVSFGTRYSYAALDKIDAQLQAGKPVIIHVDFVPSTPAIDEHWVLVVGKQGSDYIINDPRDGVQHKFSEIYGDPKSKIYHVCTYNYEKQAEPLYRVRVTINNLLIRGGSGTSYPVVYRYASGEYDVFEERNGYGRIGAGRWIALEYTERVGAPDEPTDAEKLAILWDWYKERA